MLNLSYPWLRLRVSKCRREPLHYTTCRICLRAVDLLRSREITPEPVVLAEQLIVYGMKLIL